MHMGRRRTFLHRALGGLLCAAAPAAAQTGTISGAVTDSATGAPIPGVQVVVTGAEAGASTGEDGRYRIANVTPGTYTVEARRIGYAPRRQPGVVVSAGGVTALDFRLATATLRLQQQVITGVVDPTEGTRTPFTVGRVDAAQIPVPPTNAVEALAGRVAGASVTTPGQPGAGINLQLRSPSSINKSNAPLIVVDGVILGQTVDASTADLNSLDIESVEVVKGAAAASLYGSRASNGVVQIRTRRGSSLAEGRTLVTIRSELGTNSLQSPLEFSRFNPYLVSNGQYVDTLGNVVGREDREFQPVNRRFQDQAYPGLVYDPLDQFFDAGQFSQSSLTIARNQAATNFLVTLSNQGSDGVILDNGRYQRNDVRLNLDHRPREDLSLSVSGYYSSSSRDDLDENLFFDLVQQAPDTNLAARDENGQFFFQPDQQARRANPLYTLATQERETDRTRALGSLAGRYTPLSWLTLDANASYDRADRRSSFFQDRGVNSIDQTYDEIGGIAQLDAQTSAFNASASANLLGRFGALTARGSGRALIEREDNERFGARGNDLLVPGIRNLNGVRSRLPVSNDFLDGSPFASIRTNSYIATAGAEYDGRYIVDALVRRDGSSLFGPDERWQTYYRGSAAWRMASESWWPLARVNEFKPRISRGTAGGRPSFPDQYETYGINDQGVLEKATLGNRQLRPELATETELGLDVIAFDRFSLQLSYARSVVEDQLVLIPLPAAAGGFPLQWQNAGTLTGRSYEATVEAQLLNRPALGWTLGVVADRTRNRITEFERSCFTEGPGEIAFRCAGVTLGNMYGQRFATDASQIAGLTPEGRAQFQVNDDGLLVPVGAAGSWRDMRWGETVTIDGRSYAWGLPVARLDSTGNPLIGRIGDANASFRYGVTNNVRWRGFTFFALVDAQVGGDIYNRTKQRMYQNYRHADVDQAAKPDERKKPLEYFDRLYNGNNVNSWFVEPGGFLKLRELSARYRFGQGTLRPLGRLGARGLTVGVIGRNLFTATDYSGYDPEVGNVNARIDNFDYPRFRTITGTVEVEF